MEESNFVCVESGNGREKDIEIGESLRRGRQREKEEENRGGEEKRGGEGEREGGKEEGRG